MQQDNEIFFPLLRGFKVKNHSVHNIPRFTIATFTVYTENQYIYIYIYIYELYLCLTS
jgi:hypothetical protein